MLGRIAAVVALTLLWPAIQLLVFWLRFGRLPVAGSVVFIPMGFVAAVPAVWLWSSSATRRRRRDVTLGYLVACPFAFLGSLLGGLVLPGIWGPLVCGAGPLVAGCLIGFAVGRRRAGAAR